MKPESTTLIQDLLGPRGLVLVAPGGQESHLEPVLAGGLRDAYGFELFRAEYEKLSAARPTPSV